jgi:hypothetical protein
VLVLPAFFDEANKLRRLTVEVMRRLADAGIATVLPDLPGCNESRQPLEAQTLDHWRQAARAAADHFEASHVLTVRAGALVAPPEMAGWNYAPVGGRQVLRSMLRARTIAAREAGIEETIGTLEEQGRSKGIELAGWTLGAAMFRALEEAAPAAETAQAKIAQDALEGGGLWLRAEPGESAAQADGIAAAVAGALGAA